MEQLENAIINDLALSKFSDMIYEFQTLCAGIINALKEIFKTHDPQSYELFKKLRLLFDF